MKKYSVMNNCLTPYPLKRGFDPLPHEKDLTPYPLKRGDFNKL